MAQGGDATMASGVKTPWETGDTHTVLAKLQVSGSIFFHKLLGRPHNCKADQCVQLAMPVRFIEKHGVKFEEWAILRTRSCPSKPWRVRLSAFLKPNGSPQVQFYGGWKEFVVENCLKEDDSLVFVLNVDARSEFQVYIFLGTGRLTGRASIDSRAPTRKSCNNSDGAKISEQTRKISYVGRNKPYAVQRSIRKMGDLLTGKKAVQEEVPASFVRTHGMQLQDDVELQGLQFEL